MQRYGGFLDQKLRRTVESHGFDEGRAEAPKFVVTA